MGKYYYVNSDVPWREWEKICHEVNTNYAKYKGLRIIAHSSVGIDNHYYIYYIENRGFDDYSLIIRVPNLD